MEIKYNKSDSTEQLMEKSGVTWDVLQKDCYITGDNGKPKPVGRKALVRSDNGKVLTVTGDKWKPVSNFSVIDFFHKVAKDNDCQITKIGEIRGGRGIWAQADIGSNFELKGGDKVKGNMVFVSFHEVGKATYYCATPVRLWCDNQIALHYKKSTRANRQNHMREFDFQLARDAVGIAREEVVSFGKEAEKLSKLKLNEEEVFGIFARHFVNEDIPDNMISEMLNGKMEQPLLLRQVIHSYEKAPGAQKGTGWGVLNAVTHWADHVAGTKPETRFDRANFGENAKLKLDVKKELLELA